MVSVTVAFPEDLVSQLPGAPVDLATEVRMAAVLDDRHARSCAMQLGGDGETCFGGAESAHGAK